MSPSNELWNLRGPRNLQLTAEGRVVLGTSKCCSLASGVFVPAPPRQELVTVPIMGSDITPPFNFASHYFPPKLSVVEGVVWGKHPWKKNQDTKVWEKLAHRREFMIKFFFLSIPLFKISNKIQTLHQFSQCMCKILSEDEVLILCPWPE